MKHIAIWRNHVQTLLKNIDMKPIDYISFLLTYLKIKNHYSIY